MESQNPDLVVTWIKTGMKPLLAIKGWTVTCLQEIGRSITAGWQTFQEILPTAARALEGVRRVTRYLFRKVSRYYKSHKLVIKNIGHAALVSFIIGRFTFT